MTSCQLVWSSHFIELEQKSSVLSIALSVPSIMKDEKYYLTYKTSLSKYKNKYNYDDIPKFYIS